MISVEELRDINEEATQIVRNKMSFIVTVLAMRKHARAYIRNRGSPFENKLKFY